MNRRRSLLVLGLGSLATLTACAKPQVVDYADQRPLLELDQYFNGRVLAHGIFLGRSGKVERRFTVVMDCHWEGDQGVLDEHFEYDDGSRERRVWRLTKHADGRYSGRADDVIGEAQGQVSGNAFRWHYTLNLKVDDEFYEVNFDDWMFLIDESVMLNRATMSKFGIRLGEVFLSFRKA